MKNRHLLLGIAGALLVVVGLMALWWRVDLSQYDHYGMQISCGRGFRADLSQAADAGDGLVAQCGAALLLRRIWAIPVAVLGWLILTVILAIWLHTKPPVAEESTRFWELRGDAT